MPRGTGGASGPAARMWRPPRAAHLHHSLAWQAVNDACPPVRRLTVSTTVTVARCGRLQLRRCYVGDKFWLIIIVCCILTEFTASLHSRAPPASMGGTVTKTNTPYVIPLWLCCMQIKGGQEARKLKVMVVDAYAPDKRQG